MPTGYPLLLLHQVINLVGDIECADTPKSAPIEV
jgi:hypothetical protein